MTAAKLRNSILLVLLTTVTSHQIGAIETVTQGLKSKKYDLLWNSSIASDHYSNQTDSSNLVKAGIGLKAKANLTNYLSLSGDMKLQWAAGRNQSWYGSTKNKSGIAFKEAIARLTPHKSFELVGGAPNLSYLKSPLLVSGTPFPGIRGTLTLPLSGFELSGKSLYAIPSSDSLDSDRLEKEEEPRFTAHTLELSSTFSDNYKIKVYGTKYKFEKLPSLVAEEGRLMGNSVLPISTTNYQFEYKFAGTLVGIEGEIDMDTYSLRAGFQRVENSEAPIGRNRGELAFVEGTLAIGDIELTPRVELFFNESDSTPAYYNSAKYGHNNRTGSAVELSANFYNSFTIKTRYTKTDIIKIKDTSSSNDQQLFIALETLYESI